MKLSENHMPKLLMAPYKLYIKIIQNNLIIVICNYSYIAKVIRIS